MDTQPPSTKSGSSGRAGRKGGLVGSEKRAGSFDDSVSFGAEEVTQKSGSRPFSASVGVGKEKSSGKIINTGRKLSVLGDDDEDDDGSVVGEFEIEDGGLEIFSDHDDYDRSDMDIDQKPSQFARRDVDFFPSLAEDSKNVYKISISNIPRCRIHIPTLGKTHTANLSAKALTRIFLPNDLSFIVDYVKPVVKGRDKKGSSFSIEFEIVSIASLQIFMEFVPRWRCIRGFIGVDMTIERVPVDVQDPVALEKEYPDVKIPEDKLCSFLRSTDPRESGIIIEPPITDAGNKVIQKAMDIFHLHKTVLRDGKQETTKLHNPYDGYATQKASDYLWNADLPANEAEQYVSFMAPVLRSGRIDRPLGLRCRHRWTKMKTKLRTMTFRTRVLEMVTMRTADVADGGENDYGGDKDDYEDHDRGKDDEL
ncbi:hypothetical protein HK097_005022 [Rhizophlyctis rosea]|uniref:Uncharacterized protein n=1 Tax=Rhizophlyctis rosea TaxID=64517 RepID=A0AAD5SH28_9FUNG|nr:hypothetical protein HK097_005022 [Rhizophlyctis rosea]